VLAAGLCLAAAPEAARAQDREPSMFAEGTWTLELYGTYFHSFHKDDDLGTAVAGGGYYFDDRHAVRAEVTGFYLNNEGDGPDADDTFAPGGNLGLRYHFYERDRLTLFFEGLVGFFYGFRNFPQGGTHFNFNEQVGLGATYRVGDNAHLVGGFRYMHVSNARIRGEDENPTFDGMGAFFGVTFTY
jgi:hypothetical protein